MPLNLSVKPSLKSLSTNYRILSYQVDGTLLRYDKFNGRDYIVCPVVAMIGNSIVWSATAPAPEFVPADVLQLSVPGWGYRPVVMNHPQDGNEYVSANSPQVLEKYKFGFAFYPRYTDKHQLMIDAWLDPTEAENVPEAQEVIERLQANEIVEVSCGQFVIMSDDAGEINGQSYYGVWQQILPDHVAILSNGSVGACSVEMGCGANRVMVSMDSNKVLVRPEPKPIIQLRSCALSQARTPSYTGTETTSWTVPNFSTYIKYLHPEANGPASVSQCSQELKNKIAQHSLLGDPNANNLHDLTVFPVVNPVTGKLNEKALQKVVRFNDSNSDDDGNSGINAVALKSAQDIASRLLNSEFGLEVAMSNNDHKDDSPPREAHSQRGLMQRLSAWISKFRVDTADDSYRDLFDRLYDALHQQVPMFLWLEDIKYQTRKVLYSTETTAGWDGPVKLWERGYTLSDDGVTVTLLDDAVEVKRTTTYEVLSDSPTETQVQAQQPLTVDDSGTTISNNDEHSGHSSCSCKGEKNMADKRVNDDGANGAKTQSEGQPNTDAAKPVETTTTQSPPATPPEEKKDDNNTAEKVEISKEELQALRSVAAIYKAQEGKQRESLISTLKSASKYSEDQLKAKSTDDLITLADSLGVLNPNQEISTMANYTGARLLGNAPSGDGDDDVLEVPKVSDLIRNKLANNKAN